MPVTLRPATAADQSAIKAMVRDAGLNPLALHWQRFLMAEDGGSLVGIGQVRIHAAGVHELASLVVAPDHRRRGIGDRLVVALMNREQGPVYLLCQHNMAGYYRRFGFVLVAGADLPPSLRRWHRLGNLMASLASRLGHESFHIIAMTATAPLSSQGSAQNDTVAAGEE